jgi:hypothetical protein
VMRFLSKGWWPCLKGGGCSIGRTQLMMDRREGGRTLLILALIKMRRGWMAMVEVLWWPDTHRWQLSWVICDQTHGQQWQYEHGLWWLRLLGGGCSRFGVGIEYSDETADFISWCCGWFWKRERNAEETNKID